MIYLCVISRVSRVISRVISIICDLDAATRVSAISTRRLVEKRKYKQCAAARVFLRCAPWLGAQDEENFGCRQPFLIRKWLPLGAIPLFGAQRSSQTWHAAFPSTYTFRMEAQTQRRARLAVLRPSRFVPKLVDSAKTTRNRKWLLNSRTWRPHCRMVRAATHEKVSAAMLLLPVSMQQPIGAGKH